MMLTVIVLSAAGLVVVIFGALLLKSRQGDNFDSVPQSVLTRINAEYRDTR
jgi:hypothetical protein